MKQPAPFDRTSAPLPAGEASVVTRGSSGLTALQVLGFLAAFAFAWYAFHSFVVTALSFGITLGVLVFVHEWGHFQFARWAGMKVNRFGIGFPPWIYTREHNDIKYSLGAIPIGGMVDIAGLGSEEEMVSTAKAGLAGSAPATDAARARRPPAPHGQRLFQDAPLGWRFLTLFAGPMMNFIFAIVVFIGVYSIKGIPNPDFKPYIASVTANFPAAKAGLLGGDHIVSIDGTSVFEWSAVTRLVKSAKNRPLNIVVLRGSRTQTFQVKPISADINNLGKPRPTIGIAPDETAVASIGYIKVTPVEAVESGFYQSIGEVRQILDTIKRAATLHLSREEVKGIGGPVKIAQAVGTFSQFGAFPLINIAATLSVNLGLLNLLPFPALDGGRIMFLVYEGIMRRPINARAEGLVHVAGMVMLLAFMAFITVRDLLSLHSG